MTTFRRSYIGHRHSTTFSYLAFIAIGLAFVVGLPASSSGQDYVPDEVLVGVRPDSDDANASARLSDVGTSIEHQEPIHMHRLKLPKETTVQAAIAALIRHPDVVYAEPNYYFYLAATPNDASFSSQYGPQKVQANAAWAIWRPQSQVVIAVLDSGIDSSHPDMINKVYRDASGNVIGYDAINKQASIASDVYGHGTHVAGIAAAQINNGVSIISGGINYGIAGIAGWNGLVGSSDTFYAKLMSVRVLDNTNHTPGNDATEASILSDAILWASGHGAKIINMSLWGYAYSSTVYNAIQSAWNNGCLLVAAAGNGGSSALSYPAAYPNVISVANTDNTDRLAVDSQYGSWVNVAAPGSGIFSTVPTYSVSGFPGVLNYGYYSGTSMSCPHVCGEAALIWSQNPNLTNSQVKNLITSIWDPYTAYPGHGNISPTGGRVNVYRALRAAGLYRDYFDLNQDGTLDLLFENHATGEMAAWYLTGTGGVTVNGAAYIRNQIAPTPSYPQNPAWPVVGTGDFNSDGHPDLLFQNHSTGQMAVWYLGYTDGAVIQSAAYVNQSQVTSFPAVAAGDFDGNGHLDILFHNPTTGQLSVWFLGGTGGVVAQTGAYLSASQVVGWSVVGLGDFNQDGKLDILWTNPTTGQLAIWYLDGIVGGNVQVLTGAYLTNPPHTPIGPARGVGDFNQDGVPDVLFENLATGAMEVWYQSGTNGSVTNGYAAISQAQSPSYPVELPH